MNPTSQQLTNPSTSQSSPAVRQVLVDSKFASMVAEPGFDQREFALKNHDIPLLFSEHSLFVPNATTRLFSKVVRVEPGDTVIDLGSGVGPLAVWAALEPSQRVIAVEKVARQCELIRRNAALNNVSEKITVLPGSLFSPLPSGLKVEVIIGDLSGIAEGPARVLGWYPPEVPSGGFDGTDALIPLIEQAGQWLSPNGRLYFPVAVGLSDNAKIMQAANTHFRSLKKVVDVTFPLTEEQLAGLRSISDGLPFISISMRGSRHIWRGEIYEATEPV